MREEEKIFKYLDGELGEEEMRYVEGKYREEIEFYRNLLEISRNLPRYPVPDEVWLNIERSIRGRFKRYALVASIIAGIIIGGFVYSIWRRGDEEKRLREREVEMVVRSWERSLKEFEYFRRNHPEYSQLLEEAKIKIISRGERTLKTLETSWRR
jgi:tetratricopeptide (TPR) repeat protein